MPHYHRSLSLMLGYALLGGLSIQAEPPQTRTKQIADTDKPARTDLYGDPLPARALARLGTMRFRHGGFGLRGLTFLPDGKALVAANEDGSIWFWEPTSGRLLREMNTRPLSIHGFALSADGRQLAVAGYLSDEGNFPTAALRILETSSGKEIRSLPRDPQDVGYGALAFTSDGKLLASIAGNGVLHIEEIASGAGILRQLFPRDILANLAISPDSSTLAVASGPNTRKLYLWNWQSGEEPRQLKVGEFVARWLCFSPDSKVLASSGDREAAVYLWDVASGRLLHQLEPPGHGNYWLGDPVFSPDGKILAAAGQRRNDLGTIHFWNPATGQHEGQLDGDTALGRPTISPDSRLSAASAAGGVRVWDLRSRKELAPNDQAHRSPVGRVAVSAHGLVATAGDDHTVRLWNLGTGRQLLKLTHGHIVRAIALSPDGTKLASSSLDDTVRLWDVSTGHQIYSLAGHGKLGGRRALGLTPDGLRLLSWGDVFICGSGTSGRARPSSNIRSGPAGSTCPMRMPSLRGA